MTAETPTPMAAASSAVPLEAFDEIIERRDTNSMKWAGAPVLLKPEEAAADPLPMWVADTDFRAPQPVIDALHKAVDHGIFGYPIGAPESYKQAIIKWQQRRYGWQVEPEWIVPASGIITALKTAVQAFTEPGDSVLIQPPVYSHFHDDVVVNGRVSVAAPLVREGDVYVFDPVAFEAAIQPNTKLFIMSNPHNPTGNVWSAEEQHQIGEICARHNIIVVADEIHEDLVMNPEKRHIPFASLGDEFAQNAIVCTAPSKTFNLAGLQTANVIIPNQKLRDIFSAQYNRNSFRLTNVLGMVAAEVAYRDGEPWLNAMLDYVRANHAYFADAINENVPELRVLPTDSLYLAWIDCRGLELDAAALNTFFLTEARLWLDDGRKFGKEGFGYMRINLGCPRSVVEEAVSRITAAVAARRST